MYRLKIDEWYHGQIMSSRQRAADNGTGAIGIKIFGAGQWNRTHQREESINFAVWSGNVHALTIDLTSVDYVADSVSQIIFAAQGTQA
jgi:hypothetical protein